MTDEVISNSSPLIGLDRIGRPDIVESVFGRVLVPPAVVVGIAPSVVLRPWMQERPLSRLVPDALSDANLDAGETDAIALALELNPTWIVLDDLRARRLADRLGLPVIGTVGILRTAKLLGIVDRLEPLIDALRTTRFFVDQRIVDRLLEEFGEI